MKKSIKIALVVVFVIITGFGVYHTQKSDSMSSLVLANIEALARYESPDFVITCGAEQGVCWEKYSYCYPTWNYYVDDCRFTGYQSDKCATICFYD